jgi:hypothetical protein
MVFPQFAELWKLIDSGTALSRGEYPPFCCRLERYLLYAFLRNFIERASVFDFEPVFVYNLKGCQIVAGGRSIA